MSEKLDESLDHPAYLCGRLLAVYDGLQYFAHHPRKVNATVSDRYYALASVYPQLAFPRLTHLSLKHLQKLRGAPTKRGLWFTFRRQIEELHARLAERGAKYPPPLSLEDQGRFAIGFHHQRAEVTARSQASDEELEKGDAQ